MAYPTVAAPYGLKPVNLIGGQVYTGSTRNLPVHWLIKHHSASQPAGS